MSIGHSPLFSVLYSYSPAGVSLMWRFIGTRSQSHHNSWPITDKWHSTLPTNTGLIQKQHNSQLIVSDCPSIPPLMGQCHSTQSYQWMPRGKINGIIEILSACSYIFKFHILLGLLSTVMVVHLHHFHMDLSWSHLVLGLWLL